MKKTAVIGLGCAGYHAIKAMRENGYNGQIHVYSDSTFSAANPMLTTYYVSGKIPEEAMFPFGSLEMLQDEFDLKLHMNDPVLHIDTLSKKVITQEGAGDDYDQILITTGARAVSPNLGQGGFGRTFLMRTPQDAIALRKMLDNENVRSAFVVGASMVGIKAVQLLHERNIKVYMADMAQRLFPLACMAETAEVLEKDLESRGIDLLLGKGVDHVEETQSSVTTTLTDGQSFTTDLLVLCIGTRPNVELAANVESLNEEPVQINRGIVTDDHMRTNIPGIYAAGDCCEALNLQTGKTMIIGLWANAAEQGRTAGTNMAGKDAVYKGSIPSNITHYFDQTFIGIGDPNLPGERYVFNDPRGMVSVIYGEGKLECVNILGNYRISGMVKEYFINRIIDPDEKMTLEDIGFLRANGLPEGFIEML